MEQLGRPLVLRHHWLLNVINLLWVAVATTSLLFDDNTLLWRLALVLLLVASLGLFVWATASSVRVDHGSIVVRSLFRQEHHDRNGLTVVRAAETLNLPTNGRVTGWLFGERGDGRDRAALRSEAGDFVKLPIYATITTMQRAMIESRGQLAPEPDNGRRATIATADYRLGPLERTARRLLRRA